MIARTRRGLSSVSAAEFAEDISIWSSIFSVISKAVSPRESRARAIVSDLPRANTKEFNYRFSNHQIAPQPNMRLKLMQYQAFGDALGHRAVADRVWTRRDRR